MPAASANGLISSARGLRSDHRLAPAVAAAVPSNNEFRT
jgi:hypothetical protein